MTHLVVYICEFSLQSIRIVVASGHLKMLTDGQHINDGSLHILKAHHYALCRSLWLRIKIVLSS